MARRAVSFNEYEQQFSPSLSFEEQKSTVYDDSQCSMSRFSIDSLISIAKDSTMSENRHPHSRNKLDGSASLMPHVSYQLNSISDVAKSIFLANSLIEAVENDFAVASTAWASRFKQLEEEKEEYKYFCDAELDRALVAAKAVTVAKAVSDAKVRDLKRILQSYDRDFKILKDECEVNKFDDVQQIQQVIYLSMFIHSLTHSLTHSFTNSET